MLNRSIVVFEHEGEKYVKYDDVKNNIEWYKEAFDSRLDNLELWEQTPEYKALSLKIRAKCLTTKAVIKPAMFYFDMVLTQLYIDAFGVFLEDVDKVESVEEKKEE